MIHVLHRATVPLLWAWVVVLALLGTWIAVVELQQRRRGQPRTEVEERLRQELDQAVGLCWILEHERDAARARITTINKSIEHLTHKLAEARGETLVMRARWVSADEERQRVQAEADRYAAQLTRHHITLARADDDRSKVGA